MHLYDVPLAFALVGLGLYAVLAGADFGAGFWDLTAGGAKRGARLRGLVHRSIGPVWEANHVWLILVLVVMWTCFPHAFGPLMETLYVPLFIAAVGIIFRGTAYAVRGEAASISEARILGAVFALSSVLTPFSLGCVIGAVASGKVPAGGDPGMPFSSWTGATALWVGALAVVVGAYVASVFLAADAVRAGAPDLAADLRRRALGTALVAGAMSVAGLFVIRADERDLFDGLTSGAGLAAVIASAVAGAVTLWLLWRGRFEPARYTSGITVGAVLAGWAFAQRPFFLPHEVTLRAAAAGDATLAATLIVLVIALLVIVPSLAVLFRLTLDQRLRGPLEPIFDVDEGRTR
jgi:cytochrome d ubiquinol oxidase subunit II